MEGPELLVGCCLLVAVLVGTGLVVGSDGSDAVSRVDPATGSSSPLDVRIEPGHRILDSRTPVSYAVSVYNPADGGHRSAFLTVGVSPPDRDVGVTVENRRPWFVDEDELLWAKLVTLRPGEYEVFGVAVPPEAAPGDYELNSTVGYVDGGNYTRSWDTARLTVQSCRSFSGWLGCHWQWLLPLASLVVAVLAFFGFGRVRDALSTVGGTGDDA